MNVDKCIATIIDETKTKLPKEDIGAIVKMLLEYDTHPRNQKVFGPFSPEQGRVQSEIENASNNPLSDARDMLIARARLIASQQKMGLLLNAEKRANRMTTYDNAPSADLGVQAKLIGTNTPFLGSRDSAAAAIEGALHNLVGNFDAELRAAKLDREFASRGFEADWAKELFELNSRTGKPGITKSPQALQIAQIVQNMQKRTIEALNREGAFIGSYDGYIAKTSHSSDRVRQMGEDAWVGLAHQFFDIPTIYPNRDQAFIDTALRDQFKRIVSGLHDSYDPAEMDLATYTPGQNLAKKISESRVIHFKDAESWLNYMAAASDYNPTQSVFMSANRAARDVGLMRVWGTNPKAALASDMAILLERARDKGDFTAGEALGQQSRNYDLWMSYMTGEANHIHNQTAAAITSNVLAVQRLAKLGFLPFAQITDLSNVASELRYQGVPFVDRMTGSLLGYFRGAVGSEKRQVADLLNAYLEGEIQNYGVLMETNDPRLSGTFSGTLHKLQQWMFKYTGAEAMTNRARGAFMYMMARHMGQHHGMDWNAIGPNEQRIMSAFNIGEHEWNALSQAPWLRGSEGNIYLTPKDALNIPDSAVDDYARATGHVDPSGNPLTDPADFRNEIADRLYSYYADRMNYGVLNPGVGERAIMFQGAKPGEPLGVALRLISQFKSFTVAQLRKTWGREIYGQDGFGAATGMIEFMAYGTILGVLSNSLSQLFKGQNPFAQWEQNLPATVASGFVRGGMSSVMGDYLFSDFSRNGATVASYALGPTFGNVEVFSRIYAQTIRGQNPAGDVLSFARSITPFANLYYTKLATDFMLWNSLTDWASPGYLQRAEKRLKDTQGLEYLKYPIDFSPKNLKLMNKLGAN